MWRLTGAGNDRNLAEQTEDLRTKQRTVPNCQELVEENLCAGKWFLVRWVLLETEWVCCRTYVESRFSKQNKKKNKTWSPPGESAVRTAICPKTQPLPLTLESLFRQNRRENLSRKKKAGINRRITHAVSNTLTHTPSWRAKPSQKLRRRRADSLWTQYR